MIRGLLVVAALGGVIGADDDKDLAKALAGRVPGKAETCVSPSRVGSPQIFGDRVLLYRDGARMWRNDLPEPCPGLDADPVVVTEVYGGQVCRNDQFYTLQRGGSSIPGPRCRLGNFVPWTKAQ